jgi:hypothetical protein
MKRYNLYTFRESKLIWTETENLKEALTNFRKRKNINSNGTYHPNMDYVIDPMQVITVDRSTDGFVWGGEKILAFNRERLEKELNNQ